MKKGFLRSIRVEEKKNEKEEDKNQTEEEIKEKKEEIEEIDDIDYRNLANAPQEDSPFVIKEVKTRREEIEELKDKVDGNATFEGYKSGSFTEKGINKKSIFQLIAFCLIILIVVIVFSSYFNNQVGNLEGIIVKSEPIIYVGEPSVIEATATGEGNLRGTYFYFKIVDNSIAKLNSYEGLRGKSVKNKIEAITTGKLTVSVYAGLQGKRSETIEREFTVCKKLKTSSLQTKNITLDLDKVAKIDIDLGEDPICYEGLHYKVENESIATVDSDLKVNPKKIGETNIIITLNKEKVTAKLKVIDPKEKVPVKGIKPVYNTVILKKGATYKLAITFDPENTTNKNISWKSSDSTGVKVDNKGVITGIRSGSYNVYATSESGGHVAKFNILVR